ncbi:MAG TPA: glycoside hydrolase family 15 protein [Solirubrobacteraceae bacterium]|nr:glycoside hydrolase family 15 protein [Solirubrobacteraceae bacterium]
MAGRGWASALAVAALLALPAAARAADAPGAPGDVATWTTGDKDGIGTATSAASKVWLTLNDGELTEVYAPDLGTPSVRDLQFAVSDGSSFVEREREDATHVITQADPRSLTYRQVDTSGTGRWRITKTYVTDPSRAAVLVDVRFESLTGKPLQLYALLDPALSNTGDDDIGGSDGRALYASDAHNAVALASQPAPVKLSSGYAGTSDGWTDLKTDFRLDRTYQRAADPGNVQQIAQLPLTGLKGHQQATLALGFGSTTSVAEDVAGAAANRDFATVASRYAAGWHAYLDGLTRPRSVAGHTQLYDVSMMVMAALEDKTYPGAGIASASMPWVWGTIPGYSGPYHLVWSRDLYQVASAQAAAGDTAGAGRALDYLWTRQQKSDGCFPQNSNVDGTPHWPNLQLDEVADPIILANQLGRSDAVTWQHVESAAGCILAHGPTSQERWENAEGYSPATIAAEIAGLICAAEIADRNGASAEAAGYRATADDWQKAVAGWTRTTNGPLSKQPYYLRLTVDGKANAGTTYTIGDGGPTIDQRRITDASFLELVRLGVKPTDDRDIVSTLPVVDRELGVTTPSGQFWHRYEYDGYGETPDGGPFPGPGNRGRLWPLLAGERGEYELAAGAPARAAQARLDSLAATAGPGLMLPEQVWDDQAPAGAKPGTGTLSATPLAWTHAQFVRLAWSIDAGRPVERPAVVACRYALRCR